MSKIMTKEEQLKELNDRCNSEAFIENMCLSYRHDFGLLDEDEQKRIKFECKEWLRSLINNWEYYEFYAKRL